MRTEIKILLGRNKKLTFDELEFLVDVANLILRARRSLSYTYALRFYVRGENKQRFFDFIQGDLERSLELLNDKSEQDWLDLLEKDHNGVRQVTSVFLQYKDQMIMLQKTLRKYFDTAMTSMLAGLPEVEGQSKQDDCVDYMFKKTFGGVDLEQKGEFDEVHKYDPEASHWVCRFCREENPKETN